MIATLINKNFSSIGVAVLYPKKKFLPIGPVDPSQEATLISESTSVEIYTKSSRSKLSNAEFIKYDFLAKPKEEPYDSKIILEELEKNTISVIGSMTSELEKVENLIFPTQSENPKTSRKFFTSSTSKNNSFLTIDIQRTDIGRIEFYEEGVFGNFSRGFVSYDVLLKLGKQPDNIPVLTIDLGPGNNILGNTQDMYMDPNDFNTIIKEDVGLLGYKQLQEEITAKKLLYVVISSLNKESIEINLSYKAWTSSKDPQRNMHKWVIREDEMRSIMSNPPIAEKDPVTGFWRDTISETILGTIDKDIIECPILQRIKAKELSKKNIWSPHVSYASGSRAIFRGEVWESIQSNNMGNKPSTTNAWILAESVDKCKSNVAIIITSPTNAGYTIPSGILTIRDFTPVTFEVIENTGYQLLRSNACSIVSDPTITSLKEGIDYIVTTTSNPVNDSVKKEITIIDWSKIFSSGGRVFVNMEQKNSFVQLFAKEPKGSLDIPHAYWVDEFNEPDFCLAGLSIEGIQTPFSIDSHNILEVPAEKEIIFKIGKLENYEIKKVESEFVLKNKTYTDTLTATKEADGSYWFMDTSDWTSVKYKLELDFIKRCITAVGNENIEISDLIKYIKKTSPYEVEFYIKDGFNWKSVSWAEKGLGETILSPAVLSASLSSGREIKVTKDNVSGIYKVRVSKILVDSTLTIETL